MPVIETVYCPICYTEQSVARAMPNFSCPFCGEPMQFPLLSYAACSSRPASGIGRFQDALPIDPASALFEGNTPLRNASGYQNLLFKIETENVTGSFKDRGSAMVASAARWHGVRRMAIASTGNAAISMARYADRFDLLLDVMVPAACDAFKRRAIKGRGVRIHVVEGGFEAAEAQCRALVAQGWFSAGSDNPYRLEGTKTIAYEIFEETRRRPVDRILLPIGTGNLLASVRKGFREVAHAGVRFRPPRLDGVQLTSVAPLPEQVMDNTAHPTRSSVASGINVPHAVLKRPALEAIVATGGRLHNVTDAAVLEAKARLADEESIDAEPTGAVCYAAYLNGLRTGRIKENERVVTVVTGSGCRKNLDKDSRAA